MQGRRLGNWIKQRQDATLDYTEPEVVEDATPEADWHVDPLILRAQRRRRVVWTLVAVVAVAIVFGTAFVLVRKATGYQRLVRNTFAKNIAYVEYQPFPNSAFIKVDDPSLFGAIRDWFAEADLQAPMIPPKPTCQLRVVFADGSNKVFLIDQTGPSLGPDDMVVPPGNFVGIEVDGYKRWTNAQGFHYAVYNRLPSDRQLAKNTLPATTVVPGRGFATVVGVGMGSAAAISPYDAAIASAKRFLEREHFGQALLLLKEAKALMPDSVEAQELAAIAQSQLKFQAPRLRDEFAAVVNESTKPFENRATYHQLRADLLTLAWMFPPDDAEIAQLRQQLAARRPRPDVRQFKEVLRLAATSGELQSIQQIVWSPDATRIAAISSDGYARIWDSVTGELLRRLKVPAPAETIAFNEDGRHLFAGLKDTDTPLITWDAFTADVVTDAPGAPARAGAANTDDFTASPTDNDDIILRDGKTNQATTLIGHAGPIRTTAFAPDGDALLTFAEDKAAIIWSDAPVSADSVQPDENPYRSMRRVATLPAPGIFTRDGRIIVASGPAAPAGDTLSSLRILPIDVKGKPRQWNFSPDGKLLFVVTDHVAAVVFDVKKGAERHRYHPPAATRAIGFAPDGGQVAYGTVEGAVHMVDTVTGNGVKTLTTTFAGDWDTVRYSADGRFIFARGGAACSVWEPATDTNWFHTDRLSSADAAVMPAALSPDGKRFAVVRASDGFEIINTDTFDFSVRVARSGIRSLAFSADGRLLAAADRQDMITFHDGTSGQYLQSVQQAVVRKDSKAGPSLRALVFSPDGNTLLADPADGTVRLIDVTGGREVRRLSLPENSGDPYPLSFSPDGKQILTGTILWGIANQR